MKRRWCIDSVSKNSGEGSSSVLRSPRKLPRLDYRETDRISMASSSSDNHHLYEVFLSFRGKDTRNNFTSHLLAALEHHGFHVFHDTKLKRGEKVSSELLEAIEGSKLSIVVFSKNYADSKWCLDELVKIMDCRRRSSHPQIVLPVFYDVEPSDVRNQTGEYAAAFTNHQHNHKIQKVNNWKKALNEAGELSGLHLRNDSNGDEMDFIREIIKHVVSRLNEPYLHVTYYPVEMESHVQKLNDLLSFKANDIRIVAIWGVAGIGKTTIAKALFNENCISFDGSCCFLADVRENAARPDGLITLQEKLISNVINESMHKIYSRYQGIMVIKKKVLCRKVLIVLDDVDDIQQMENLAIYRPWLKQGSRVIITTRDRSCVNALDVKFYEPDPLGANSSLRLFSWHAFGEHCPKEDYEKLSWEVVHYAGGIPLVLETLGRYTREFTTVEQWQKALVKLRMIPHDKVQQKLELSYDSLGYREKELFLDIACFFVGMDKDIMFHVLDEKADGYYPKFEFKKLCDRCLVKHDDGRLSMHDMVRDMGREIVRRKSLNDLGKLSRLFHPQDALCVLRESSGTEAIESIFLEVADSDEEVIDLATFAKMSRLRMIHLKNIKLYGNYSSMQFMEKLKWLWWYGFPLICIPSNLDMRNLVALDLENSRLKQIWLGTKSLDKLRFLNVSNSRYLTSTPDFSEVINLEKLLLRDCTNLGEIHHSIGCLHKLILLDLTNCKSLTKAPSSLFQLKSLKDLNCSGCSNLLEPTPLSYMLSRLSLEEPRSLQPKFPLTNFFHGQNCLTKLNLENCKLSCLPSGIENLSSLEHLRLNHNKLASLPASIKYLQRLKRLDVDDCVELKTIPDLPSGILLLSASQCPLLETVEFASGRSRQPRLFLYGTTKLIDNLFNRKEHALPNFSLHVAAYGDRFVMDGIPRWFSYEGEGPFISFVVPQHPGRRIKGWILALILVGMFAIVNVYNITKDVHSVFARYTGLSRLWMGYVELSKYGIVADGGDEIEIVIAFLGDRNETRFRCGLCLVYDDENEPIMPIQYSSRKRKRLATYMDYDVQLNEHLSERRRARRLQPIKYVLDHFSWDTVGMLIRELVDGGGGGIVYSREHTQTYQLIANELYNEGLEELWGCLYKRIS